MTAGSAVRLENHAEAVTAAEAFAAAVRPGAADRDRAGSVPRAELADFDRSGLPAITVPVAEGGSGLGPRTLAEVIRTIATADRPRRRSHRATFWPSTSCVSWVRHCSAAGSCLRWSKARASHRCWPNAAARTRTRSRPFFEAYRANQAQTASDDPYTRFRFGQLATRTRAAVQLLRWAADVLDELGLIPAGPDTAAHGSIAVAQAKAFASEVAVEVASQLFALTGTSGTDRNHGLEWHWRNARTHSVHDPVDWKYHHIGAWELATVRPPNHRQI